MRRPLLLTAIAACSFILIPAFAPDAHCDGKGGGPKISKGRGNSGKSFSPPGRSGNFKKGPVKQGSLPGLGEKPPGRQNALAVQRNNELRKLAQRQSTAQKLREISARNGNPNLLNTADRMDQKALDHFDKRQEKINEFANRNDPFDRNALEDPLHRSLRRDELAQLDPRILQQRQLFNEQSKLQRQFDVAQQLRDLSARNGNESLLRTAEHIEDVAAERYLRQVNQFGLLQEVPPLAAPLPPFSPFETLSPVGTTLLPIR